MNISKTMKIFILKIHFLAILLFFLSLFVLEPISHSAILKWNANTEVNLSGYKVYYGTSSRNYDSFVDVGNVTECELFEPLDPNEGLTYYIALTAYNTSDNESKKSNEVCIHFISIQNFTIDNDCDGIPDEEDNCPFIYNPDQEDRDEDEVGDVCDNCPETPNGSNGGTCMCGNEGDTCMSNDECGDCGFCSINQEDTDNDGLGDVCDDSPYIDLCQKYCNLCEVCIEQQSAGREINYRTCKKIDNPTACEAAGCIWWDAPSAYPCMLDICLTDVTGDGNVFSGDYAISMRELGRSGCPGAGSSDLCQKYHNIYEICIELGNAGRELDYLTCRGLSSAGKEACEAAGCTWWDAPSANPCMLDICLTDVTGDGNVFSGDYAISRREIGRGGCPQSVH